MCSLGAEFIRRHSTCCHGPQLPSAVCGCKFVRATPSSIQRLRNGPAQCNVHIASATLSGAPRVVTHPLSLALQPVRVLVGHNRQVQSHWALLHAALNILHDPDTAAVCCHHEMSQRLPFGIGGEGHAHGSAVKALSSWLVEAGKDGHLDSAMDYCMHTWAPDDGRLDLGDAWRQGRRLAFFCHAASVQGMTITVAVSLSGGIE